MGPAARTCLPSRSEARWSRGGLLLGLVLAIPFCAAAQQKSGAASDLPYVAGGNPRQQLDLAWPAGRDFPTVVFLHGGSLTSGNRAEPRYRAFCAALVGAGVGCARVGYRLAGERKWPAQPADVAAAFGWLYDHIAGYGGDPKRLFLVGHSSGCMLATLLAGDRRYLAAVHHEPGDIAGVVAIGCLTTPMDTGGRGLTPDRLRALFARSHDDQLVFTSVDDAIAANPSLYIGPHLPRMLFLIAEDERFQPPILEQNAAYVRRAREAGVSADLAILPGRDHESAVDSLVRPSDPTLQRILTFVRGADP